MSASQENQTVEATEEVGDYAELIDLAQHRPEQVAVPAELQMWREGTAGLALGLSLAFVLMLIARSTGYVVVPPSVFYVTLIAIGTLVLGYFDLLP